MPLPTPLDGCTSNHLGSSDPADHGQPFSPTIAIVPLPPPGGISPPEPLTLNVQAACRTSNSCPAMLIFALRAAPERFGPAPHCTVPLPTPLDGCTSNHLGSSDPADHGQPFSPTIAIVPLPPPGGISPPEPVVEKRQGSSAGLATSRNNPRNTIAPTMIDACDCFIIGMCCYDYPSPLVLVLGPVLPSPLSRAKYCA